MPSGVKCRQASPYDRWGKTGELVSSSAWAATPAPILRSSEIESRRLIQRAVDEGITFMDNAWDYHDGEAEERMGKALARAAGVTRYFL